MMKLIRWFLGKIILFLDRAFTPKSIERTAEDQARINQDARGLILYQFEACPFCVKVRRELKRLGLEMSIEIRDILTNPQFEQELIQGGGARQVPCLRIADSANPEKATRWLYESSDIIAYLRERFASLN